MIDTWEEFDTYVEQDLARTYVDNGMLRAHLTVLLTKRVVVYQTDVDEVQQALKKRFHVEYTPEDVRVELTQMMREDYEGNKHVLIPDDYFEGF